MTRSEKLARIQEADAAARAAEADYASVVASFSVPRPDEKSDDVLGPGEAAVDFVNRVVYANDGSRMLTFRVVVANMPDERPTLVKAGG